MPQQAPSGRWKISRGPRYGLFLRAGARANGAIVAGAVIEFDFFDNERMAEAYRRERVAAGSSWSARLAAGVTLDVELPQNISIERCMLLSVVDAWQPNSPAGDRVAIIDVPADSNPLEPDPFPPRGEIIGLDLAIRVE